MKKQHSHHLCLLKLPEMKSLSKHKGSWTNQGYCCFMFLTVANFDPAVTLHHPLATGRSAHQEESICCTATPSINFSGGGMVSAAWRVRASQRNPKCWSQLGRACRLSLPNGKSSVSDGGSSAGPSARWQIEMDFVVATIQRGCISSYATVQVDGSCELWKDPLILPASFMQMPGYFFQTKFSVWKKNPPLKHERMPKFLNYMICDLMNLKCASIFTLISTHPSVDKTRSSRLFRQILFISVC